jgi:hypothetical protein
MNGPGPDFTGSAPSGVLRRSKSGFSVGKFVALTAALAVGTGVAVAVATSLGDDDDTDDAAAGTTGAAAAETTGGAEPASKSDVAPPPRFDLGGPPRLDMPPTWADDPSQIPQGDDTPGPDVEIPDWAP